MAKEISFPDAEPLYVFDRDCLAFRALADGRPLEGLVTAELLMARFGARDFTEESLRKAYREHKAEIQELARNHIQNGWVDEGRVFLTRRFTRLTVTFAGRLREGGEASALAHTAHRMLTEIIGPDAETVEVEWREAENPPGQPALNLRIADPSLPYSVAAFFGPKESGDPNRLGIHLGLLWSRILGERSRKLLLKSG